ncbi:3-hydroxyacyl-[acyl-carrier-protein] dehydratase FabZ [Enhygromyxa salina]|uniref:3-hydroxyacyl-[acyl-carrier-protein] dehydratase n=1 Tax=Enhygromyxa salina TaxID=215803 RepID=A0A2S9XCL8_9BACT|nr:3-hydroxyacyl-ACP dehydratase FabZ [Enhygromyxa salina]PRP90595.1 3-hydroxyacyl-[acyl-carrier-protein] dehydratase FabZ [Enhygromyxa salina]
MALDIIQIQEMLPHRYPFLFIDRVLAWEPEKTIHARRLVSFSDPILQGHFPGMPIVPGVVQVEMMAQAAALLAQLSGAFDPATQLCLFMGVQEAKFRAPVVPGDVLDINVEVHRLGRIGKFSGVVEVEGAVRSSAKFTAIIQPRPDVEQGE